jgi:hypothetical protein
MPAQIDNLETYRQGADNFYFWLLYDRFTHTIYDVIKTSEVKHLPAAVRAAIAPFQCAGFSRALRPARTRARAR